MDHMAKYYKNLSENLFNQRDNLLRLLNERSKMGYKDLEDEHIADWSDPNSAYSQWQVDSRYGTDEAPTNPAQPEPGDPIDDTEGPGPAPGFGPRRGRYKPQYVKDAEQKFLNSPPAQIQSAQGPFIPPLLNQPDLLTPNGPEPIQPQQPPPGIARPDPNEVPGLIGLGEPGSPGVTPLPQNPNPTFTPQNPGISPASQLPSSGTPAPSDREKEQGDFETARKGYYAKRNQQVRDEAEERIAAIDALGPSNNPRTNAARAVNRLKAERALKKGNDKFNQADIDRMVKSDSKERFMSQADKDARKERDAQAVAGLTKAGHEKMGHTQNARGEWVDAQGKPASLVGPTVDRFGPDKRIQGTSMTYGEFERQTGRKYDALNKEDSTLVSRLAGAGRYGSEAARQGALSSDAMNQGYQKQNDEMAKETGRLDRQVDASQRELDRFRNDPKYRESQRTVDSQGRQIVTRDFVNNIAQQTAADLRDRTDVPVDVNNDRGSIEDRGPKKTGGQVTQAAANMTTAPAVSSWYTGDVNKDNEEIGKAVAPTTDPGNILYGANGRLLAGLNKMDINDVPEEEKPQTTLPPVSGGQVTNAAANMNIGGTDYRASRKAKPTPAGVNSAVGQPQLQTRQASPPPAAAPTSVGPPSSTTGAQNTTPAVQPTTSPVSGNPNPVKPIATPARPLAPAAPPVAVGSSVTAKATTMTTKPQLASAGAPIDAQQTGGPTAQNRGIPIPSSNPMADAQAGPLGAPLKKKLVTTTGRTPNRRA